MQNLATYHDYFEQLAREHIEVCHEREIGKHAFFFVNIAQLYKNDFRSILAGFKSRVREKGVIVLAIKYTWNGYDAGSNDPQHARMGGFVVMQWHKDITTQLDAEVHCEHIVEDFIARIIKDSKAGLPLWQYSVNTPKNFTVTPFDVFANYSGWMVTFSFMNYLNIVSNAAKWQKTAVEKRLLDGHNEGISDGTGEFLLDLT